MLFCCGTTITTYLQVGGTECGTPFKPTNFGSDCCMLVGEKDKRKKAGFKL
jgi:hypothetical protein